MEQILQTTYLWLKAGHIIFVIFWMAGLFMLPRYFVYHQEAEAGSPEEARWIDREAKLRKIILTPSLIAVWVFGIALATAMHYWSMPWLHAKLLFVVALSAYHGWLVSYGKKLAKGQRGMSGKALRMLNEVPSLVAVVVVILVVVKPF
ncbi:MULTISPECIES: CopD family protein [Novosphingobium]|uniref:Protoporphyrinogen IX oxidase n=2 Tax=Novosphingobium TaxID=165696 RepID=A0ABT0AB10_9SPHN|nr:MULTISPECIES: CopD family protein [Novosphingobium]MCJ1960376.1 CopD family protein [Novosphingobium mangrovi (ex Hu et al. 2023)]MED5544172.1 CopD family protein [Pseudomonadota bacterium]QVM84456.1 CopD family protein [Novosphingobium decolorationis]GAM04591.1 membrane protein [Novosphingobium sp. MBES04]